ncbi:Di-copper centre-containing protein [Wilcoxina mikolae CBS 423.85]|nr:Di-copper centre-containing protein [Wilcoxina mikolae CBS 423.85]
MAPPGAVFPFPAPAVARLPLDELQSNHPIQFSLFIRALDKLMKSSEAVSNPYGWFQFAGIHGLPNIAWDGDGTPIINNDDNFFGYCTHGGALFPLWHRIYLWELEHVIGLQAQGIASIIADPTIRKTWLQEAQKLRFPYWDWATNRGKMPTSVNEQSVDIMIVGETQTEQFQNPLLCYTFENNESSPDGSGEQVQGWFKEPYASEWKTTLRCPDSNGNSNPDRANEHLASTFDFGRAGRTANLTEYLYMLLTSIKKYIPFSTTGYYDREPPPAVHYASLEEVHNIVHLFIGGDPNVDDKLDGHMALNEYAAFDPIFCHCNVDRIFALWQALNPTASFTGSFPSGGSATTDENTPESASTGLVPFKRPVGGEYWTSQEIQHLAGIYQLGYYYPELPPSPPSDPAKLATEVADTVRTLYGPVQAEFNERIPEGVKVDRREWQVASRIDRFAVEGSFYVHFYLGDIPDAAGDYVDWVPKDGVKSNYVGSNAVFSSRSGCANCERQREAGRQVTGVTSLTDVLLALKYDLNDVKGIEERLKKDLNWVVQKANGEVVPLESVPSLMIAVTSTPTKIGKAGAQEWDNENSVIHEHVTKHRDNGLKDPSKY